MQQHWIRHHHNPEAAGQEVEGGSQHQLREQSRVAEAEGSISIGKKRAAHLHCAEAINSNTSLCHPKVLNASHATHSRHGYAARQSNGDAALAKKRGPEGFLCNQSTAQQRENLRREFT
jgi:hypothetical protein